MHNSKLFNDYLRDALNELQTLEDPSDGDWEAVARACATNLRAMAHLLDLACENSRPIAIDSNLLGD